jgi:prepilin-type processing-associated H-X9-DG protein
MYPDTYAALITPMSVYMCPSSGEPAHTNTHGIAFSNPDRPQDDLGILEYVGIAGSDRRGQNASTLGTFYYKSATKLTDITDGTSNTMGIGEHSGLTKGQIFSSYGSTADNVISWDIGTFPDIAWPPPGTPNVDPQPGDYMWACKSIWFPPNSPYFYCNYTKTSPDYVGVCNAPSTISRSALKSNHTGGINVLFMDGSIHFLSQSIDMEVYRNLADRADGNVLGNY